MPELARFYGISVLVRARDHPPPHVHVRYGEHTARLRIRPLIVQGVLPRRARLLVLEWAREHESELQRAWDQAQRGMRPDRIAPLE